MSDLFVVQDFTEWAVGDPLVLHDGRVEACPVCGRPAWAQRHTPYKGRHSAHYVHRVWLDDEKVEKTYERCYVEDAPRGDGLSHTEAAELEAWATAMERHCALLKAALGTGWYHAPAAERGVLHYLAGLEAAATEMPLLVTAGPTLREMVLTAAVLAKATEDGHGR